MTIRATWNGAVLAESDDTVVVEGNHYFPPASLHQEHFVKTRMHTICPWKGIASYYTVTAGGVTNPYAAWYYRHPTPLVRRIKNHVAFAPEVEVAEVASGG